MSLCSDRNFLCDNFKIRYNLAKLQNTVPFPPKPINNDEAKYKKLSYNGSFHKGLQHDSLTGELTSSKTYEQMVGAILTNNQTSLANLQMATGFQTPLSDPLSSLASTLVGADKCAIQVPQPSFLYSAAAACEMIEMYSLMLCRDVPFIEYSTDPTVSKVLSYLTTNEVLFNLPDYTPKGTITAQTIFRGISSSEKIGPYVSQLLLLNVPMGNNLLEQQYFANPTKQQAIEQNLVVEWGRNSEEMIKIQNTTLSTLPPSLSLLQMARKTIYSGRVLSDAVHNDPPYQFMYQAALILQGLGTPPNPGFPQYSNQAYFGTGSGICSLMTAIAEVADLAIKHVYYWKWQVYRKLRPDVFSLWIDNVKNNRVSNNNYSISSIILNNPILNDIKSANAEWGNAFKNSYTLSMDYREGSPTHPSYPAGHGAITGACTTIMKIYFNAENLWSSLPGLQTGQINRIILPEHLNGPSVEPEANGGSLIDYTGSDASEMTIYGEINKLASNVGFGRMWAGIHYRSDIIQGILMGEQVAISFMEDQLSTWVQNNLNQTIPQIKFRKFDGTLTTIKPTVCKS